MRTGAARAGFSWGGPVNFGPMNFQKYLPTKSQLSQEVIATLAAILISAWIVSKVPAFKKLVKDSNT